MGDEDQPRRRRRRNKADAEEHTAETKVNKTTEMVSGTRVVDGKSEEYELEVRKFVTEPAYVRASFGQTRKIEEFESVRVDVSVSLPCYAEEIEETLTQARELAMEACEDEIEYFLNEDDEEYGEEEEDD